MKINEALPPRPLKPGQSARITGKDPNALVRNIKDYIRQHKLDISKLTSLERQLANYTDYGLTPAALDDLKQEIEGYKRARDPKTHGYDKIIDQIVPIIKQRCSKYLPSLLRSENLLYRGMGPNEHKNRLAFRANSRDARLPADSEVSAQRLFDKALTEMGFTALRSNSIFATNEHFLARQYGTEYIIFPTNDATFAWSEKRADLVLKIRELQQVRESSMNVSIQANHILDRIDELKDELDLKNKDNRLMPHTLDVIKQMVTQETITPDAVISNIEYIKMNRFALKDFDSELMDMLQSLLKFTREDIERANSGKFEIDINKFQKKFAMSDRKFPQALSSGHEILIHGEYIAVLSSFEKLLREALTKDEAVAEAIAKPPTLQPGTTKELKGISKYGKILQDLAVVRDNIKWMARYPENLTTPTYKKSVSIEKSMAKKLDADQIIDYINSHCSNYVKEVQAAGKLLYRGVKSDESENRFAFVGNSRVNRKPRDSAKRPAKEFDKILSKLGFEALRSNSIFVTPVRDRTSQYGTRYIIFPLNSAKFTYTEEEDLVLNDGSESQWSEYFFSNEEVTKKILSELNDIRNDMVKKLHLVQQDGGNDEDTQHSIYYLEQFIYLTKNIIDYKRINVAKELYSKLTSLLENSTPKDKHYEPISKLYNYLTPLMPKLKRKINIEKFKEKYKPTNTNLDQAIAYDREIYISGHYLALRDAEFGNLIKERILGMKMNENVDEALKPGQIKSLDKFKVEPKTLTQLQKQIAQIKASLAEYNKILDDPKNIKNPKALNRLAQIEKDATKTAFADNKEFDKLMKYLYKNCGNYIGAMQNADKLLYRGMDLGKPILHGRSWTDRRPKDSHKEEQVAFDRLLKALNIEALRSNSIFTTSDFSQANEYGEVYMIFPLNSAKFAWSQTQGDLVIHHGDITSEYLVKDAEVVRNLNAQWKQVLKDIRDRVRSGKGSEEDIASLKLFGEAAADSLIGMDNNDAWEESANLQGSDSGLEAPFAKRFEKILMTYINAPTKLRVKQFQNDYKMTDKNFAKALESENEIYVSGEYIAIDYTKHGEQIRNALGIED